MIYEGESYFNGDQVIGALSEIRNTIDLITFETNLDKTSYGVDASDALRNYLVRSIYL